MRSGLACALLVAAFAAFAFGLDGFAAEAQGSGAAAASPGTAEQEKQECIRNLKTIYGSIQAYQLDHRDIPNWLSDLVPQYLADANLLVCPVCRRTGKTESAPLADPKLPSSYLFEFCPVPLGALATNAPNHTRRDWKRRQMGMLGSVVPILRCRHHDPVLNVAFDGQVYESPSQWELAFTNRISLHNLQASALFADVTPPPRPLRVPARSQKATAQQLDLGKSYNAGLMENWLGKTNENLGVFPRGFLTLAGTQFDARGVIQLGGKGVGEKRFPREVKGIPVKQKCKQLHFLHAASGGKPEGDEGTQIGSYFVSFAGNPARIEIPIVFGQDVRDWHPAADEPELAKELKIAWTSEGGPRADGKKNPAAPAKPARLFKTTWVNLLPDLVVDRIDFVSAMNGPAPFLVAITAE